jgi:DNA-binding SARP family transcriptional activator/tetratricopeptide (TPR) repeat protein
MIVEFRVLGSLEASCDGVTLPISSSRQRTVLATLLLRANRVVAVDDLAEVLWGSALPPSARVTVQNYVKRLRDALGHAGGRIVTQSPGYLIRVAADELDASLFDDHLDAARTAADAGSWETAATKASAALLLWRGDPLADVPSEYLTLHEVSLLKDLRLQATEIGIEAALRLGRASAVIGELRRLLASDPLRERLSALLMAALYEDGRQADALSVYQQTRDALVAELGVEPGHELRDLHQRILAGGQALLPPASTPATPGAPGATEAPTPQAPRQLPAAVGCFTGRAAELAALTSLLDTWSTASNPTMVISAIGGTAGVGKTVLAVQWAHAVAERFPDGQLYVNLRGYDPDQPTSAEQALAGFLQALGVPGQDIPDELEDRTRLYRSRLAGRRVLVLLDNARDSDQVRPLLPGDPGCTAVVTSRDALAGLVAVDGARRLDLDVLPLDDAVALLRSLIGPRTDGDPRAVTELAVLCARLPLALRIAAELAAARRGTPLADLVAELTESRLDGLDAGEARACVRAVFSWSFEQLPSDMARAFALTGLHPGPDLDVYAAAALTGTRTAQARRLLGRLGRASLIQTSEQGRFGMHDLLRDYAREQPAACGTSGQRQQALTRLFDYYLATALAAMDILLPAEAHNRPHVDADAATLPAMPGEAEARAWLDRERANLVAIAVHCAGHGWPQHTTGLAGTLFRYLMTGSYLIEAHTIYSCALLAARQSGDLAAEAGALNGLGSIGFMKGRFRDAADHCLAGLKLYRQCGDRAGEARILRNLGITELRMYNLRSAADYYRQAIATFEDTGDILSVAGVQADLAEAEIELGRYDQASEHLQRALPVLRQANDADREAEALEGMGILSHHRGELTQAADFFEQALAIYRRINHPNGTAGVLCELSDVSLRQGKYQQAIGFARQALALHRETGDRHGETKALRSLAEGLHGIGQPGPARAELTTALQLATETANTYQQASVHRDLAESHHGAGEGEQARRHWEEALALYTQLGATEADQVRSQLSAHQAEQAGPRAGRLLLAALLSKKLPARRSSPGPFYCSEWVVRGRVELPTFR